MKTEINIGDTTFELSMPNLNIFDKSVTDALNDWCKLVEAEHTDEDGWTVLPELPQYKFKNLKLKSSEDELNPLTITVKYDTYIEKLFPENREYNHNIIFDKYLDDKCPVCNEEVLSDSEYSHTESGGKCMAKYFKCSHCESTYVVGFNRSRQPILSEITVNTLDQ